MSLLNNIPTNKLWEFISNNYSEKSLELKILHALLDEYTNKKPEYIPYYELKRILKKTNSENKITEKELINFFCFDLEILELYFKLIDDEDNHFDISLEQVHEILSGQEQTFGNKKYSANAIKNNLFTCFNPTNNFMRLIGADK